MHPSLPKLAGVAVYGLACAGAVACAGYQTTGATWVAILCLVCAVPVASTIAAMPPVPKQQPKQEAKP